MENTLLSFPFRVIIKVKDFYTFADNFQIN